MRAARAALLATAFACALGCGPAPIAVVADGPADALAGAVAAALPGLVGRPGRVEGAPPGWLSEGTCVSAGGLVAARVQRRDSEASRPANDGRHRGATPTVVLTERRIAVDRPGAPCQRVLGAAPEAGGAVLVSVSEVRSRCSSLPLSEAVARVAAHELGHALGGAVGDDGVRCDARGCHCRDPACLLADEAGGCPQPGATFCARCAGRLGS